MAGERAEGREECPSAESSKDNEDLPTALGKDQWGEQREGGEEELGHNSSWWGTRSESKGDHMWWWSGRDENGVVGRWVKRCRRWKGWNNMFLTHLAGRKGHRLISICSHKSLNSTDWSPHLESQEINLPIRALESEQTLLWWMVSVLSTCSQFPTPVWHIPFKSCVWGTNRKGHFACASCCMQAKGSNSWVELRII